MTYLGKLCTTAGREFGNKIQLTEHLFVILSVVSVVFVPYLQFYHILYNSLFVGMFSMQVISESGSCNNTSSVSYFHLTPVTTCLNQ